MLSRLLAILKARAALTAIAAIALVGSATAAFAATPTGRTFVQHLTTDHPATTSTAIHPSDPDNKGETISQDHQDKTCPDLAEAQNLAAQFHLSTATHGSAVQAICALHMGLFKGTTRRFGFGEIDQLLTLAQAMGKKSSRPLSDATISSSLAAVLQLCGSTASTMDCLKDHDPGFHPGHDNGNEDGNSKNNGGGNDNGTRNDGDPDE